MIEGIRNLYEIFLAEKRPTIDIATLCVGVALTNITDRVGLSLDDIEINLKGFKDYPDLDKDYGFRQEKYTPPNYSNFEGGVFRRTK